eukprot:2464000-Rhodomonas_salina.3
MTLCRGLRYYEPFEATRWAAVRQVFPRPDHNYALTHWTLLAADNATGACTRTTLTTSTTSAIRTASATCASTASKAKANRSPRVPPPLLGSTLVAAAFLKRDPGWECTLCTWRKVGARADVGRPERRRRASTTAAGPARCSVPSACASRSVRAPDPSLASLTLSHNDTRDDGVCVRAASNPGARR